MAHVPLPPGVIPRPDVLDVYWRFAAERQDIFFRRLHGQPAPWTDDPVLATHKFCNAYRAADRVSQVLLREVIYSDEGQTYALADTAFRILLFKFFNRPETWHWLQQRLGPLHLGMFDAATFDDALTEANRHFPIYTSAYISCASPAFGHRRTHQNHLALLQHMFRADALPDKLEKIIISQAKASQNRPQSAHFGLPVAANVNVL